MEAGRCRPVKSEAKIPVGWILLDAEKCAPRVFAFEKSKLQKKRLAINELAAAAGVEDAEMEAGGVV